MHRAAGLDLDREGEALGLAAWPPGDLVAALGLDLDREGEALGLAI